MMRKKNPGPSLTGRGGVKSPQGGNQPEIEEKARREKKARHRKKRMRKLSRSVRGGGGDCKKPKRCNSQW